MRPLRQAAFVLVPLGIAGALGLIAQAKKTPSLPYRPIDQPHFVAAAQAAFLHPQDLLIGVNQGAVAKAYPAAIVAQHGIVEDRMPDGPITVTW